MLQITQDLTNGQASKTGAVDPSTEMMLLPSPSPGMVRVPLWGGIQADGPEPLVTCHAVLRPVDLGADWALDPRTCILWTVKLTPAAMVGGEFFIAVPLFPLPEGWEVIASWSYQTLTHPLRTRAVSVEVPAASVDWSRYQMPLLQPRLTTV